MYARMVRFVIRSRIQDLSQLLKYGVKIEFILRYLNGNELINPLVGVVCLAVRDPKP